jgi:UDP-glucose 4-epimerase
VAANLIFAKNEATGVYNIGRGERITLNALANSVIRRMGKNIKPVYAESRAGDIKHSLADISKARAVGYNPQCDVETCLTEVIRSM